MEEKTQANPTTDKQTIEIKQSSLKLEKKKNNKKPILPLIAFIVGILAFIIGAVMFVLDFLKAPNIRVADRLVEVGEWQEVDAEGVIWNFSEIGKGTLTTNNHTNDYEFIWRIDGNTLKIKTEWLYNLNNEYEITLDAENFTIKDTSGEEEQTFTFKPVKESEEN